MFHETCHYFFGWGKSNKEVHRVGYHFSFSQGYWALVLSILKLWLDHGIEHRRPIIYSWGIRNSRDIGCGDCQVIIDSTTLALSIQP